MSELIRQEEQALTPMGDPRNHIGNAVDTANALMEFIDKGAIKPTIIQGNKHLRVEHWLFLAQACGCHPIQQFCNRIEIDGVAGFHAKTNVVDAGGHIVGSGEAWCMENERNWKGRDHHALASMAQTRSVSKALSSRFRWIVGMAGADWSPTPAEEMLVVFDDEEMESIVVDSAPGVALTVEVPKEQVAPVENPVVSRAVEEMTDHFQQERKPTPLEEFDALAEEPKEENEDRTKALAAFEKLGEVYNAAAQKSVADVLKTIEYYAGQGWSIGGKAWKWYFNAKELYGDQPWFPS
jgi:hypothetical protein